MLENVVMELILGKVEHSKNLLQMLIEVEVKA
jgi:hypothetical protein